MGQIIGVGVVRGVVHNTSEWSYRIPFGLQWAFAVPILVGVVFAPESREFFLPLKGYCFDEGVVDLVQFASTINAQTDVVSQHGGWSDMRRSMTRNDLC